MRPIRCHQTIRRVWINPVDSAPQNCDALGYLLKTMGLCSDLPLGRRVSPRVHAGPVGAGEAEGATHASWSRRGRVGLDSRFRGTELTIRQCLIFQKLFWVQLVPKLACNKFKKCSFYVLILCSYNNSKCFRILTLCLCSSRCFQANQNNFFIWDEWMPLYLSSPHAKLKTFIPLVRANPCMHLGDNKGNTEPPQDFVLPEIFLIFQQS